jgi:hypothetical protein
MLVRFPVRNSICRQSHAATAHSGQNLYVCAGLGWWTTAAAFRALCASVEDRHEEGALVSQEAPGLVEPHRGRLAAFVLGNGRTILVVGLDVREAEQGERDIRRRGRTQAGEAEGWVRKAVVVGPGNEVAVMSSSVLSDQADPRLGVFPKLGQLPRFNPIANDAREQDRSPSFRQD